MKVGVIGLGRMGGPMARNIVKGGHTVTVYDVRREAAQAIEGASAAANPAAVAAASDAVLISVPGPEEDDAVILGADGILAGARDGLLVIDATTITVPQTRTLAATCSARGLDYLDAPVSGAHHGAVAGTLTVMAGGDAAAFARAEPVFKCVGTNIRHIGPTGCGTAIKLINQAVYVSYMSAFAEGLALGDAVGIPLETMLDVLGSSAAGHPMIATKYDEIRGKANTRFAIERATLFLDLAQQAFRDVGCTTPVFDAAMDSLRRAEGLGLANEDIIVARSKYLGPDAGR
ncbi:MAG: NAD(P)-dependent oxidoreductase [Rhodospirillaceae bacterium]